MTFSKEDFLKCVDDEPEFPGDIPNALYERLRLTIETAGRDFIMYLLRDVVRMTKSGIRDRVERRFEDE